MEFAYRFYKALGLVKRTCMDFKDITRLRTLYRSLVRPLPKYSCETWNPKTQRNYNRIEAIQRRATKFILRYNEDYNIRLKTIRFTKFIIIGDLAGMLYFYLI